MPVELTPETRKDLRDGLLRGVQDVFSGDPGNTISGQPVEDFLAGPPPGDPLGDWQHRAGRAACDRWARGDRATILPGRDVYYRGLCEPYLGPDMPGEPTTGPPFEGGQCPGVRYLFRYRGTIPDPPTDVTTQTTRVGPISFDTSLLPGDECPNGEGSFRRWRLTGSNGTVNLWSGCEARLTVLEVRALDPEPPGGCGNLGDEFDSGEPSPSPDPNPGPVPGIPGYPFPNVGITISPDGDVIVDFGDGEPPEVVTPGDDGGSGGGGSGGPPSPGSPDGPSETGAGGTAEGDAPEGEELVGLLVQVLAAPIDPNIFANNPATVYRGIGYVRMGYPGRLGLDISGGTVISPQFFHAQQRGLTSWAVGANLGFNLRVTPYYREFE